LPNPENRAAFSRAATVESASDFVSG